MSTELLKQKFLDAEVVLAALKATIGGADSIYYPAFIENFLALQEAYNKGFSAGLIEGIWRERTRSKAKSEAAALIIQQHIDAKPLPGCEDCPHSLDDEQPSDAGLEALIDDAYAECHRRWPDADWSGEYEKHGS